MYNYWIVIKNFVAKGEIAHFDQSIATMFSKVIYHKSVWNRLYVGNRTKNETPQ